MEHVPLHFISPLKQKILLVSATVNEVLPTLQKFGMELNSATYFLSGKGIDVLISGIGMTETAMQLSAVLTKNKYSILIQAGIAGTLNNKIKIGEVVIVNEDFLIELGAEDGEEWIGLKEMKLEGFDCQKSESNSFNTFVDHLPKVKGISVNRVHGNESSIEKVKKYSTAEIESMEGFAFLRCANFHQTPAIQIRSVSNVVERRNKNNWNIGLAIDNLNVELIQLIEKINEK